MKIKIGESAKGFRGDNYAEVVKRLKEKGFTDISLYRTDDLWGVDLIHKEGDIKRISINGKDDFKEDSKYRYDAKIKIVVITHKGKGYKKI